MSKYQIVVNYDTGDSFGSQEGQEIEVWENADEAIAKENAQRIKAQQEFYTRHEEAQQDWKRKPKDPLPVPTEPFIVASPYNTFRVLLLDDQRVEQQVSCSAWQGYFESFNYVEVIKRPYRLC